MDGKPVALNALIINTKLKPPAAKGKQEVCVNG